MGVGDDETLDGSVSITVIATGFDAEQQNEITNTETKKIIHTLGDDAKAQLDLTPNVTATQVVLPQQPLTDVTASEVSQDPIIVHTLFEVDEQEDTVPQKATAQTQEDPFEGYIATTDPIKNIDIESNLVDIHCLAEFEQLVINEVSVNNFEVISPEIVSPKALEDQELTEVSALEQEAAQEFEINDIEEDVIPEKETAQEPMLMFDMPLHDNQQEHEQEHDTVVHSLEETVIAQEQEEPAIEIDLQPQVVAADIEDIELTDHLEVVPVSEVSKGGVVTRYSLDDYTAKEEELTSATAAQAPQVTEVLEEEEELVFETKIVEPAPQEKELENAPQDPINTPISKLLRDRTEERKRKMKDFNYKFRNSASKIDDIEKQPAYKRAGIELDDVSSEVHLSRTSVSDDDDEIELKSNNSFLHDNVD
jgi:cell division protein FtsZ